LSLQNPTCPDVYACEKFGTAVIGECGGVACYKEHTVCYFEDDRHYSQAIQGEAQPKWEMTFERKVLPPFPAATFVIVMLEGDETARLLDIETGAVLKEIPASLLPG